MAEKIFKGFELITEANFNSLTSKDKQKIYFVRTSTGNTKDDGFIYFNGKKYGTGKLSSDKIQTQLTALKNEVDKHIANNASVTGTARTTQDDNGNLTVNDSTKWLSGAAIEQIKTYVDSEDVKGMELVGEEIQLKNKAGAVLAKLNASKFIKEGMLESVTLTSGTTEGKVLRFTWNTASGNEKTTTDIEVSEFFHEISGDTNTITVTQPASGTTGSLKISAKTVANVSGVTSGATALMTGGITQQYVQQEINTLKTGLNSTLPLSATTGSVTYATAKIVQTDGKLSTTGSNLVLNVATGLTKAHAGFVYDSTGHTFTANASDFTKKGLLDAQEVIALLRNNNTNVANALTYLKGQITTVTGSDYITVTKAEGTNNYTVSAAKGLTDAITHANSAVQSVNGNTGTTVTLTGADIKVGKKIVAPEMGDPVIEATDTLSNTFEKILYGLGTVALNTLHGVNGSDSITVSAMSDSQEQTISVKAKPLSETEKAAGQIEIKTDANGIYGMLYFGGDDVEV